MTYCISDIHGELDRFEEMLKLIGFNDNDTLYILGDVVDRGRKSIDILERIIDSPNMKMILGNHEKMMLDVIAPKECLITRDISEYRQLWLLNGGKETFREFTYKRTAQEKQRIIRFLRSLPLFLDLEIGEKRFHLVHGYPTRLISGYPIENKDDCIWKRVSSATTLSRFIDKNTICIVGHTPTPYLTQNFSKPFKIYHGDGWIDIDCACGNLGVENRRLACLRLEDMKEFYV